MQTTDETLFSHRIFKFNSSESKDSLNVTIPEVIGASYGLFVWPYAPVLAQYIWYHRMKIETKTVLEIGCGTALPGIVAAKLGAKVILSDSSEFPHCLSRAKQSLSANGLSDASVVRITWGQFSSSILELGPVDIILGSDCFYDTKVQIEVSSISYSNGISAAAAFHYLRLKRIPPASQDQTCQDATRYRCLSSNMDNEMYVADQKSKPSYIFEMFPLS